jgi:aryl carrier-like protein
MSSADGVRAFVQALAALESQILIAPDVLGLTGRRIAPTAPPPNVADVRAPVPEPSSPAPVAGAPRNDVEQRIATLWAEVLGVDRVGVDDNFFDLGGDSLIGLQFIAKAKKAGLRITNRQIFEHQTVAALAAALAGTGGPGDTA